MAVGDTASRLLIVTRATPAAADLRCCAIYKSPPKWAASSVHKIRRMHSRAWRCAFQRHVLDAVSPHYHYLRMLLKLPCSLVVAYQILGIFFILIFTSIRIRSHTRNSCRIPQNPACNAQVMRIECALVRILNYIK